MADLPRNLTAITFGTNDIAAQRRFYEAWGWEAMAHSNDEYVAFQRDGLTIAFFNLDKLAQEAAPGAVVTPIETWNRTTLATFVASKDDVDAMCTACVDAGATAVGHPEDRFWGGRSGYIADPDGNRWEIVWLPTSG